MKIAYRHPLPADPQTAWAALQSAAYGEAVAKEGGADMELLEDSEKDGARVRRLKVTGKKPLPGFAQAALGVERLSYEQIETTVPGMTKLRWKVIPQKMADRVRAEGTYELVADALGSARVIEGVIEVRIPLVGGRIEKALAEELQRSYDKTALFAQRWLTEKVP
jgi:Protein of unknown function (DUF2505)